MWKTYSERYAYSLRNSVRGSLPTNVLKILLTDCTIRRSLNNHDIQTFQNEIADLTQPKIKKKIKSLCNKIGDKTHEKIRMKLQLILEEHQYNETLVRSIVHDICNTAMNLIVTIDKSQKIKYEQLKYYGVIIDALFKSNKIAISEYLEHFNKERASCDAGEVASNSPYFEEYLKNKKKYINLYVLFVMLVNMGFISHKIQRSVKKQLITKIVNSNKYQNDTYVEIFIELQNGFKLFVPHKIRWIKNNADMSSRIKFALSDLIKN